MPIWRYVKDINFASGNVQAGSSAPGVGGQFLNGPTLEPGLTVGIDTTASTPAARNKAVVFDPAAAALGASFKQSAVATQGVGRGKVGIVSVPAAAVGGEVTIVVEGPILAFCTSTANTNKAIAAGDPLTLDGAGNLTSSAANPGTAGTIVAHALGALAGAVSTPTLVLVDVGGY